MTPEQSIIQKHVEHVLGASVTFGVNDCLPFAADLILDLTGIDILGNRYRGAWSSEAEGMAMIPLGMGTTMRRHIRELGWEPVSPFSAPVGSLALLRLWVNGSDGNTRRVHEAGVVTGGMVVHRIEKGVGHAPLSDVVFCWKPPCQS
jgi:hypothetical protein